MKAAFKSLGWYDKTPSGENRMSVEMQLIGTPEEVRRIIDATLQCVADRELDATFHAELHGEVVGVTTDPEERTATHNGRDPVWVINIFD